MKWYTAIGIKQKQWDGRFHIKVGEDDKILMGMEICLWTSLLWSFSEEQQVYNRMTALMHMMYPETCIEKMANKEEFQFCFRRLCARGALCCTEAENQEQAAAVFLKKSLVLPIRISFYKQLGYFLNSMSYGNGLAVSLRVFKKKSLSQVEVCVLSLFERNGDSPMHFEEITMHATESGEGMQADILLALKTLYEKKRLSIWKVKGGEM